MLISEMLASNKKQFCFMEKVRTPDGEGGFVTRWHDGAIFDAIQRHDTTILAQQAEKEGTASTYTFIVDRNVRLAFPDVIKRLEDGETFQITSDSIDSETPNTSTLNMASVQAKKWRLPE